jgi:CRISPR/Cas system CMR-associated protein Cmr5 small subunit
MQSIRKNLTFIHKTSSETCLYLYKEKLNSIQTFCLGLLERLNHSAYTLDALFTKVETEPIHEFSIGILVRALLLDALIGMNLFKIVKEEKNNNKTDQEIELQAKKFCDKVLSDGLKNTLDYYEKAKELGIIDEQQLSRNKANIAQNYKYFFHNDFSEESLKLRHEKPLSPSKLFNNLANSTELKKYCVLYDQYLYFSKYDHFGILYFDVVRNNISTILPIYKEAIGAFVANQAFVHYVLQASLNDNPAIASLVFVTCDS